VLQLTVCVKNSTIKTLAKNVTSNPGLPYVPARMKVVSILKAEFQS